jgi:hypothetical protein
MFAKIDGYLCSFDENEDGGQYLHTDAGGSNDYIVLINKKTPQEDSEQEYSIDEIEYNVEKTNFFNLEISLLLATGYTYIYEKDQRKG